MHRPLGLVGLFTAVLRNVTGRQRRLTDGETAGGEGRYLPHCCAGCFDGLSAGRSDGDDGGGGAPETCLRDDRTATDTLAPSDRSDDTDVRAASELQIARCPLPVLHFFLRKLKSPITYRKSFI